MPRLFTALEIPTAIAVQVSMLQSGLEGARWIERENFHITLRFIGDVPPPIAREVIYELERVKSPPLDITLGALDVFGNAKPHSLFVSVKKNAALEQLRAEQDNICRRLGLEPDKRKFTPHLTIARIRGVNTASIAKYLFERGLLANQSFPVSRFVLLSSRDSVGGGPYRLEESYELVERERANA